MNTEAIANLIKSAELVGFTAIDKTQYDFSPTVIVTTKNGNEIYISRTYNNKSTHWRASINWTKDATGYTCIPSHDGNIEATINKNTDPKKLGNWLITLENRWGEWFNDSKEMAERNNNYNNKVKENYNKILATGMVEGSAHSEKLYLKVNGDNAYGDIQILKDTVNFDLRSLSVDKLIQILNILK